jgi:hypothetical protein
MNRNQYSELGNKDADSENQSCGSETILPTRKQLNSYSEINILGRKSLLMTGPNLGRVTLRQEGLFFIVVPPEV